MEPQSNCEQCFAIDTSEQILIYRGCHSEFVEDGCQPADVDKLPNDLYGVGIILHGTMCSCNRGFCNAGRISTDTNTSGLLANSLIVLITTAMVSRRMT